MEGNPVETILQVDNLSKKFYLKKNTLSNRQNGDKADEFYAIRNLTFNIKKGEICGLIGRNGAGKTTLLELLSGIMKPSEGEISIFGKTASVIDIGTGMHRDLSGLENIFLSGAILGMKKAEIEERLPEIIAFSELEDFIQMPVKHYSSGMFMRLAFSVITHLNADIMLIDEIIGVGDLAFSEKTTARIIDICRKGRSAIIATHSLTLVRACCNTAIYLKNGSLILKDNSDKVEELYLSDIVENSSLIPKPGQDESPKSINPRLEFQADENENENEAGIKIVRMSIDTQNPLPDGFCVRDEIRLELLLDVKVMQSFIISVHINQHYNQPAFCFTPERAHTTDIGPGQVKLSTIVLPNTLNQGLYSISVFFVDSDENLIVSYKNVLNFKVNLDDYIRDTYGYKGKFSGPAFIGGNWNIERR